MTGKQFGMILWQGKLVAVSELSGGELLSAYDCYLEMAMTRADEDSYIAVDAIYMELFRRLEK